MKKKIAKSIKTLKLAAEMSKTYYGKPMIVCYSGGKDSDVLLHLAKTALKPTDFEVLNSHTSVDAPETVYHIRQVIDECRRGGIAASIRYPKDKDGKRITMWNLIVDKQIPPTRLARYCCKYLKETSTPNRMACLGVRAAESAKRQGREAFGVRGGSLRQATFFSLDHAEEVHHEALERDPVWDCTLIKTMREHGDTVVNPIYEWSDDDVWKYIQDNNIKTNPLYEKGYSRVGCIGCPMATYKQKMKEFADYPKYKDAYIRAFNRMLERRKATGKKDLGNDYHYWETGEDVFLWWIEEWKRNCKGQLALDMEGNIVSQIQSIEGAR